MSISNFDELMEHAGHSCIVQVYVDQCNDPVEVSIECIDCQSVLKSYAKGEEDGSEEEG